ncbi:hypothetical protein AVEN_130822-1 [Araneus ventricosus]|uniref:Uncharacterized protein n=1 Tax=Araneus ventricosus TaxID=182803 RepID=A0A4Y2W1E5_ARAVE|nr:hypothetical protein AVEN_130822-1 [Araneus ventricosus]
MHVNNGTQPKSQPNRGYQNRPFNSYRSRFRNQIIEIHCTKYALLYVGLSRKIRTCSCSNFPLLVWRGNWEKVVPFSSSDQGVYSGTPKIQNDKIRPELAPIGVVQKIPTLVPPTQEGCKDGRGREGCQWMTGFIGYNKLIPPLSEQGQYF